MPKLLLEQVEDLEKPISLEFLTALKETPLGKAPSPDGFNAAHYKTYQAILGPHLIAAFRQAGKTKSLCQELLHAHVTVILKEGEDPGNCSSYRPISLLNVDTKLSQSNLFPSWWIS